MRGDEVLLHLVRTRAELAEAMARLREGGRRVALVPTMGALHEGHLALLDQGREGADAVAISIFVNPLQFGPGEDLDRYPRTLERDLALAGERGAVLAFAPDRDEMYPGGDPQVQVTPGPMGDRLCGAFRPGHFQGVLTVVARLFGLFRPAVALFGRKDLQQSLLVRRMVTDLELGVEVVTAPTVREADGLALSSRNAYLTPPERTEAAGLFRALTAADTAFREGERDPDRLRAVAVETLSRYPLLRLQYAEVVEPERLETPSEAAPGHHLALAAHLGSTRLIDNVALGAENPDPRLPSPTGEGVR